MADCDNFFVSCERRRDKRLTGRPVVVLSGLGGCVVARSNEAKAAGVLMGAPFFQMEGLIRHIGCEVIEGDLTYYRAVSRGVASILRRCTPLLERYSIDESFLDLSFRFPEDKEAYCKKVRSLILSRCGVPVSIGIAPTKTLAKLGSAHAKKSGAGVFTMNEDIYRDAAFMSAVPTGDVWGVGPAAVKRLAQSAGIKNAWQLACADDLFLKEIGITLLFTSWELRGRQAFPLEENSGPPKSIQIARSFDDPVYELAELRRITASYAARAAKQLAETRTTAHKLSVSLSTSPFRPDFILLSADRRFSDGASSESEIVQAASALLDKIFRPGRRYIKAGVILTDLEDVSMGRQSSLFGDIDTVIP